MAEFEEIDCTTEGNFEIRLVKIRSLSNSLNFVNDSIIDIGDVCLHINCAIGGEFICHINDHQDIYNPDLYEERFEEEYLLCDFCEAGGASHSNEKQREFVVHESCLSELQDLIESLIERNKIDIASENL